MKIFHFTISLIILLLTACTPKQAMVKVDTHISHGEYKKAAKVASKQIDKSDLYAKNNLLWELESGSAYFYDKDTNNTIKAFNNSELILKHFQEQILAKDISQTLTSTLLNDTTRPYIGTQYDAIMVNTYKALEYMASGDMNSARVEFNRAIDRQRRAKIYFSEMIQKEKDAITKKEQESIKDGKNLKVDNSVINSKLSQEYPSLYAYKPYPDFINPITSYLAALFARADGNAQKAEFLFKEAYGMMPDNEYVKSDLQNDNYDQTVWLIFENGQAPVLKEWRIDFPIWIFSNNLSFISIALPKLVERHLAYSYLAIKLDKEKTIQTKFLSSMDRVIKTEFTKSYKSTVNRAILSAATKAAISYAIHQQGSNSNAAMFMSLAASVYQIASTQADTRIWTTLPKEFQLAKFQRPQNGVINIVTPSNLHIKKIKLPNADNILIYVKIATPNARASVRVIPF